MLKSRAQRSGPPFAKQEMDEFMAMGWSGIQTLTALQKDLIGELE